MKASLQSARIAPKKANIIAKLVRGMSVPDAVEALRNTHKKGARLVEKLLLSAMANANHNSKQDPQTMIIKTIVVNQGTAYRRGMPKARGQMRPFRKFLSHIDVVLGFADGKNSNEKKPKQPREPKKMTKDSLEKSSQKSKSNVKSIGPGKKKDSSSVSSVTSVSST